MRKRMIDFYDSLNILICYMIGYFKNVFIIYTLYCKAFKQLPKSTYISISYASKSLRKWLKKSVLGVFTLLYLTPFVTIIILYKQSYLIYFFLLQKMRIEYQWQHKKIKMAKQVTTMNTADRGFKVFFKSFYQFYNFFIWHQLGIFQFCLLPSSIFNQGNIKVNLIEFF
mgnify:CR=1 FL=1